MIVFPIGDSGQRLIFSPTVLAHFNKHRQTRWWQKEAGGQLFARFVLPEIRIEEATGPRISDWRTRNSYRPDMRAEQQEIAVRHSRGLHFIGDWHTHPEQVPAPSLRDVESMRELVTKSKHSLNAFVLVIVGRERVPAGLSVSLIDTETMSSLHLAADQRADGARGDLASPPHKRSLLPNEMRKSGPANF